MALPNPNMEFTPFNTLPAAELDKIVENIEFIAEGTGLAEPNITSTAWRVLGEHTLLSAGDTLTVTGLLNKKFLAFYLVAIEDGTGTLDPAMRLNNDSGTNYTTRYSANYGADTSTGSLSSIGMVTVVVPSGQVLEASGKITNLSSSPKTISLKSVNTGIAGSANAIHVVDLSAKWVNTSSPVSSLTIINNGTGSFAAGSTLLVVGR